MLYFTIGLTSWDRESTAGTQLCLAARVRVKQLVTIRKVIAKIRKAVVV